MFIRHRASDQQPETNNPQMYKEEIQIQARTDKKLNFGITDLPEKCASQQRIKKCGDDKDILHIETDQSRNGKRVDIDRITSSENSLQQQQILSILKEPEGSSKFQSPSSFGRFSRIENQIFTLQKKENDVKPQKVEKF